MLKWLARKPPEQKSEPDDDQTDDDQTDLACEQDEAQGFSYPFGFTLPGLPALNPSTYLPSFHPWSAQPAADEPPPSSELIASSPPQEQPAEEVRRPLPDGFWTDFKYYPGPISSVVYYDPGPRGQALRKDIAEAIEEAKTWQARRDDYVSGSSKHKV